MEFDFHEFALYFKEYVETLLEQQAIRREINKIRAENKIRRKAYLLERSRVLKKARGLRTKREIPLPCSIEEEDIEEWNQLMLYATCRIHGRHNCPICGEHTYGLFNHPIN